MAIKISELTESTDLNGLYTLGTNNNSESVKVPIGAMLTSVFNEINGLGQSLGLLEREIARVESGIDAAILDKQKIRFAAYTGSQGAYDTATGTWKMHRVGNDYLVTGLSADDMEAICATPNLNTATVLNGAYIGTAKTNLPINIYRMIRSSSSPYVDMRDMARGNTQLQVFYFPVSGQYAYTVASTGLLNAFYGCTALRVVKYLDISKATAAGAHTYAFYNCAALVECYLKGLNTNLNLGDSPLLSQDSLIYIVENAGTSAKTLTVTGRITGSNWSATETYPTWAAFETLCQSKNIIIQTT